MVSTPQTAAGKNEDRRHSVVGAPTGDPAFPVGENLGRDCWVRMVGKAPDRELDVKPLA